MPVFGQDVSSSELYQAVQQQGGWLAIPGTGLLEVTGADRVDFLHRQSTNDLRSLQPGKMVTTVLTSPAARILDVLRVFSLEDRLQVATLPGYAQKTLNFLRSRIFFNDNVSISDLSTQFEWIELVGPVFPDLLTRLDPAFTSSNTVQQISLNKSYMLYIPPEKGLSLGGGLLIRAEALPEWKSWAKEYELPEIPTELREVLRVEAALPGPGKELTDDYNPLEVGLGEAISASKGCYTGQEVIARQITYDKIVRQLYPLQLSESVPEGSTLQSDGTPAGEITSCVQSPVYGWIALAVLKTKLVASGSALQIVSEPEVKITLQTKPWNRP